MSSKTSSNSEPSASELLEVFEDMFPRYNTIQKTDTLIESNISNNDIKQ